MLLDDGSVGPGLLFVGDGRRVSLVTCPTVLVSTLFRWALVQRRVCGFLLRVSTYRVRNVQRDITVVGIPGFGEAAEEAAEEGLCRERMAAARKK